MRCGGWQGGGLCCWAGSGLNRPAMGCSPASSTAFDEADEGAYPIRVFRQQHPSTRATSSRVPPTDAATIQKTAGCVDWGGGGGCTTCTGDGWRTDPGRSQAKSPALSMLAESRK